MALATEPALRPYVAQHHALWHCAQEQILALEETLAAQPAPIAEVAARACRACRASVRSSP